MSSVSGRRRILPGALVVLFIAAACSRDAGNPTQPDEIRLLAPCADFAEITPMRNAYSAGDECPWGYAHTGLDFFPAGNQARFQAGAAGTVNRLELFHNERVDMWQVNLSLNVAHGMDLGYAFEPYSGNRADAEAQLAALNVRKGDRVGAGDLLGTLLYLNGGTHVDFGVIVDNERVCPEPYFTEEARAAILQLLRPNFPAAQMCY